MIQVTIEPTQLVMDKIDTLSIFFTNSDNKSCTHVNFKLRLPPQIILLGGSDKIDIAKIDPHQQAVYKVRVRPKQVGSWIVASSSFSYRDSQGQSQHPSPLQQEVEVVPKTLIRESQEPKVLVKLLTEVLHLNEWENLDVEIFNSADIALYNFSIKVVGPVTSDFYNTSNNLGNLLPGETRKIQVLVRAEESGNKVPLHIQLTYSDKTGRSRFDDQLTPIQVTKRPDMTSNQSSKMNTENNARVKKINISAKKIFVSYSHVDEKYMTRLVSMLRPLEKQGIIEIWHDREITVGNDWYLDIQNAINTCDMALLLISIDFLNSRFIQEDELPRLLQLRKEKGLRIIPIIVRHCTWTSVPILKDLQALPKDGRPVISFKGAGQPDRIWTEIVNKIEELAQTL